MPAANLKALSPAPRQTPARTPAANAHSVHAVGDSAEQEGAQDQKRRKLKICSQESNWKRPARPAAGALLLSVCKATAVSAQHGRRGKEGEQEGEGDCALHVCSYPTTRQGLTAIMPIERPGGDIRTSRKEGVERE